METREHMKTVGCILPPKQVDLRSTLFGGLSSRDSAALHNSQRCIVGMLFVIFVHQVPANEYKSIGF